MSASGNSNFEDYSDPDGATEAIIENAWVDGNDCTNAIDLSQIASPYYGSTTPASNSFSFCEMGWSKDLIFFYDLGVSNGLKIWMSDNNFDTRHTLRWGGNCPGEIEIECVDDPDLNLMIMRNKVG